MRRRAAKVIKTLDTLRLTWTTQQVASPYTMIVLLCVDNQKKNVLELVVQCKVRILYFWYFDPDSIGMDER